MSFQKLRLCRLGIPMGGLFLRIVRSYIKNSGTAWLEAVPKLWFGRCRAATGRRKPAIERWRPFAMGGEHRHGRSAARFASGRGTVAAPRKRHSADA
jgi:hypothetical protein